MTFEQFQNSRQWTDDLAASCPDHQLPHAGGWVYLNGQLWIEDTSVWPTDAPGFGRGKWYTRIANNEYQSDLLEECERPLFEIAVSEEMIRLSEA